MKYTVLSAFFLINTIAIKAQTLQIREVKPFSKLEASGAANIVFTQSDTLSLKVISDDSEMNNIYTSFEGETLVIKARENFSHAYKIYVSNSTLNQITCNGTSKITTTNALLADSLSVSASDGSDLSLNVKLKTIDVIASGVSNVSLEGTTQALYSNMSDASSLKAYSLNSSITHIKTSSASSAKVYVKEHINANATGSSTIQFKGDPRVVSAEASSSSSISKVVGDEVPKNSESKKDSTIINFKKKKLILIDKDRRFNTKLSPKKKFHHWAGFSLGVNGWLSNGSFTLPKSQDYMRLNYGKSFNFQLNPFEKAIHLHKNYINVVLGLGFEWNQYELSNHTKLNPDTSYTFGSIDTTQNFHYKKNRLKTTFVNVPVLIEFNTNKNPKKAFHLALGVIGGYKLGSRTRQILEQNANYIKIIRKDDYNINFFRVNAHASIGYHNLTLFIDYALTPLFKDGKGPRLYPFTIGVHLITF